MIEVDGALHSGSGTLVRQTCALAALTGQSIHVTNARANRKQPGLRRQHAAVVEAICRLVSGDVEGVYEGSREFTFVPGAGAAEDHYSFDIGSAGSSVLLALAILPVLAFRAARTTVEIRGGIFQDFAPSIFHTQHVIAPLLGHMGLRAEITMRRPGYVPRGGGILNVAVQPAHQALRPLVMEEAGDVQKIWGIALASHLHERQVAQRIADSAVEELARHKHRAHIEAQYENTAAQPGAALALFADLGNGARLGADMAGAIGRRSEHIGRQVARQLADEIRAGATLDCHAADQIIPFAALAAGESRFRISKAGDHIESNAWMAKVFLNAEVKVEGNSLVINGTGFKCRS